MDLISGVRSYQRNPMSITPAAYSSGGTNAIPSVPADWKPEFAWVEDDESTLCGEWFNGNHARVDIKNVDKPRSEWDFSLHSKRARMQMNTSNLHMYCAIARAIQDGRFDRDIEASRKGNEASVYGTFVSYFDANMNWFVSRHEQIYKCNYAQWQAGPKNVFSTELWMFEDLESKEHKVMPRRFARNACSRNRKLGWRPDQDPQNSTRQLGYRAPDGLLFYQPEKRVWAKFTWDHTGIHSTETFSGFKNQVDRGRALHSHINRLKTLYKTNV